MSRIAIMVCFSRTGSFERYVDYLIKETKTVVDKLAIVVNGSIKDCDEKRFRDVSDYFYIRENSGFDAAAWKYVMCECIGWDELRTYDEILLMNDTFYGPFYSMKSIFNSMSEKNIDFWGITKHGRMKDPTGYSRDGIYYEHIQSYFLVIRKNMLLSDHFKDYWENQKQFDNVDEVIANNETYFTHHFESLGFKWGVYTDTSDLDDNTSLSNVCHYGVNVLGLLERGCPIIKKKIINMGDSLMSHCNGDDIKRSLEFVKERTEYDCSLIYEDALKRFSVYDLYNSFGLNYVESVSDAHSDIYKRNDVVAVVCIEELNYFIRNKKRFFDISSVIDVIMIVRSKFLFDSIQKYISGTEISLVISDKSYSYMIFVELKDKLSKYRYVSFLHESNVQNSIYTVRDSISESLISNCMYTPEYVNNVIDIFEKQKHIGVLSTPPLYLSDCFDKVGENLVNCCDVVDDVLSALKICVHSNYNDPQLVHNYSFWFRTDALKQLFECESYGQISDITDDVDDIIEKVIPYIAQFNGYYTGHIMSDEYSKSEIIRLRYIVDGETSVLRSIKKFGNKSYDGFNKEIKNDFVFRYDIASMIGYVEEDFINNKNTKKRILGRLMKKLL